jgi:hypothetical protein
MITARTVPANCTEYHDHADVPIDRRRLRMRRVRLSHWFGLSACTVSVIAYLFTSNAVPVFWAELTRLLQKV